MLITKTFRRWIGLAQYPFHLPSWAGGGVIKGPMLGFRNLVKGYTAELSDLRWVPTYPDPTPEHCMNHMPVVAARPVSTTQRF